MGQEYVKGYRDGVSAYEKRHQQEFKMSSDSYDYQNGFNAGWGVAESKEHIAMTFDKRPLF